MPEGPETPAENLLPLLTDTQIPGGPGTSRISVIERRSRVSRFSLTMMPRRQAAYPTDQPDPFAVLFEHRRDGPRPA
jgi:hypothetical protein